MIRFLAHPIEVHSTIALASVSTWSTSASLAQSSHRCSRGRVHVGCRSVHQQATSHVQQSQNKQQPQKHQHQKYNNNHNNKETNKNTNTPNKNNNNKAHQIKNLSQQPPQSHLQQEKSPQTQQSKSQQLQPQSKPSSTAPTNNPNQQQRRQQLMHTLPSSPAQQSVSTPKSSSSPSTSTAPLPSASTPASNTAARNPTPDTSQTNAPTVPTPAAATSVTTITAASLSPLWSYGAGHFAGLAHGDYSPRSHPTPISIFQDVDIVDISCGWTRNVAVTEAGSVVVWGWKPVMRSFLMAAKLNRRAPWLLALMQRVGSAIFNGQLTGRFTFNCGDPLIPTRLAGWGIEEGDPADWAVPARNDIDDYQGPIRAVSACSGSDWIAILSDEGQVYTAGSGFYGQLGHGAHITDTLIVKPRMICRYQNVHPNESHGRKTESDEFIEDLPLSFPSTPVVQIATGWSHTLMLTKAGQVYACGKTDTGALGITHIYRDGKRLFLPHLVPVTDAYAAGEHGAGEAWIAQNAKDEDDAQNSTFAAAQNDPSIVSHYVGPMIQVAAGMKHSVFLNAAGEVYACGNNGLNELGNGHFHPCHGLIRVKLPLAMPHVEGSPVQTGRRRRTNTNANGASSAASSSSSTADDNSSFFSVNNSFGERIIRIAAGNHHSLALSNLGHVYAWGGNVQGQCGKPCRSELARMKTGIIGRWWDGLISKRPLWMAQTNVEEDDEEDPTKKKRLYIAGKQLKPAQNTFRRGEISDACTSPMRVDLESYGLHESTIGRVVDINAGFYDSVLLTDRGYAIKFGGANSAMRQYAPHVFKLEQPEPTNQMTAEQVANHLRSKTKHWTQQQQKDIEAATSAPYRIKKMSFGLGHAIMLVEDRKLNAKR